MGNNHKHLREIGVMLPEVEATKPVLQYINSLTRSTVNVTSGNSTYNPRSAELIRRSLEMLRAHRATMPTLGNL